MSRIGKAPISIPNGVTLTVSSDNLVTVKGPKGELTQKVDSDIKVSQEDGTSKNATKRYMVYIDL